MIERFYDFSPFELDKETKKVMLTDELIELSEYHKVHCEEYACFLDMIGYNYQNVQSVEDIPFFPVRLFKDNDLKSIEDDKVFKTMTSSGTTAQKVSKIYLDRETAMSQQKVMIKILSDFWGKKRLPMLIADTPTVLKDRKMFSARGAAILGLQFASRDMIFVLKDDMSIDFDALDTFLNNYGSHSFVLFGFTYIVWQHIYKELMKCDKKYDLSNAWLMTGGGWKKLESEAVSRELFKKKITECCGIKHYLDHYGMVEQTGCIYAECEYGHLHASIYSDVIVRDYADFSPCKIGEKGIIQVVSVLPRSYPGHSVLTEDEGIILGEDDCPCGRKGKYIKILGRMKSAELRGCSDTYANRFE